jgi:hypothetical protein
VIHTPSVGKRGTISLFSWSVVAPGATFHRRTLGELDLWLREHARNDGTRLLDLPIPSNIDLPAPIPDFDRLAVAWGLSYPLTEIGEILPPSAIEDILPPKQRDLSGKFVSKELVDGVGRASSTASAIINTRPEAGTGCRRRKPARYH